MRGRRIDDHEFWAGGRSKASVFPEGAKSKELSEVEGCGYLDNYEDSEEAIAKQQRESVSKAERHDQREGYRY